MSAVPRGAPGPIGIPFQAHPKLGPDVQPHGVFVAWQRSFEVTVRRLVSAATALQTIFCALPLEENGWDFSTARIERAGTSPDMWPIWHLERG